MGFKNLRNRKTLRFMHFGEDCIVCVSHRMNQDGYFRKRWVDSYEFFHRFIYRAHRGEIPRGYEVDHLCGFRSCVNPKHLRILSRKDHLVHTNKNRVLSRNIKGLLE